MFTTIHESVKTLAGEVAMKTERKRYARVGALTMLVD